jgi:CRP-like cAMP-binding protein
MLTTIEKVNILQKAPVFQGVRTESLARVAAIAREASCDARQLLFRENEGADTMFLILEGRVALVRNGQPAQELGAGQIVGALELLAGECHRESAMATQPVRVLQIDQQEFYEAMAEDFNITRGILRALIHLGSGRAKQ